MLTIYKILSKGEFLRNNDEPLFDEWKSQVEDKLEDVLKLSLKNTFDKKNYQAVSSLSKIILDRFPPSDYALPYYIKSLVRLNREDLAKEGYSKFTNTYKQMMGEEYKIPLEKFMK